MAVSLFRPDTEPDSGVSGQPDAGLDQWKEREKAALRDRQRFEPVWYLCQAFVANRQWVGWSPRSRRVVSEPNPAERERHTVNVLTQYLMTNVGKFTADDMLARLFFRNQSRQSQLYAQQANLALEYCWDEELYADQRLYETILKACGYGTSAIQARW